MTNMNKSEQINELATALVKFQKEVSKVKLDSSVQVQTRSGGKFAYQYATLANIIDTVRGKLAECDLSYTQLVGVHGEVETCLMHKSGQFLSTTTNINGTGEHTAQEYGSLISYTRRYALLGILGIVGESDDDGQTADKPKEQTMPIKEEKGQDTMDDIDKALSETYDIDPITVRTAGPTSKNPGRKYRYNTITKQFVSWVDEVPNS